VQLANSLVACKDSVQLILKPATSYTKVNFIRLFLTLHQL